MYFKIIALAALFVVTQGGLIPAAPAISAHGYALGPTLGLGLGLGHAVAAPAVAHIAAPAVVKAAPSVDYVAYPKYEFKYGVTDGHTGDSKTQSEVRDGDVVKGSYSLVEPDGTIRTVHYTADDHNGFNAVVTRAGHAVHPATPVVAKTVLAAPSIATHALAGPAIAAPLGPLGYASPLGLGGVYKG